MSVELRREVWTLRSQGERNQQGRVKRSSKYKERKPREVICPKSREENIMEGKVSYYTWGSQPGVILSPEGHLAIPGDIFDSHGSGDSVCYQHLLRRGQA